MLLEPSKDVDLLILLALFFSIVRLHFQVTSSANLRFGLPGFPLPMGGTFGMMPVRSNISPVLLISYLLELS